jgi:hypothetical protein
MYVVLEYFAYVALVGVVGLVLFGASATVLITREGARRAVHISRQLAGRGSQILGKYLSTTSPLQEQNSPESQ